MSETPGAGRTAEDGADGRVRVTVDAWKRKLLDLSGRNRALNFKPTKVSTVAVVDERPPEVFRYLYLLEKPMRFKAIPEQERDALQRRALLDADSTEPVREEDGESRDAAPEVDFVPYDPSSVDDRHRDGFLQTASTADGLDRSLRRIAEQARVSIEELGVNTLFLTLGMLHYKESRDSEILLKAPLVLLPVQLHRKSARAGFAMLPADDDPLVNPALREYLKRSFGFSLPDIPSSDVMAEDYDLQEFFEATKQVVSTQEKWAVNTDIFLGLFSFQKFVMYKDLESNGPAFVSHRLIHRLVAPKGNSVIGLPQEIREMNLDEHFPPESTSHVVDADSSQLRALVAAAKGLDVVIEGPPGTGKSQTIANLIAQALAAAKSVLFVAEKMAALQVVHNRLVQAGLGEFCLELHSTKAQKRKVVQGLAAALDASLQPVAASTASTQRLPGVRLSLNEYVKAVHAPCGALAISPYRAYEELSAVLNAVRVAWQGATDGVTREHLDEVVRDLKNLASHSEQVGDLATNPWRDATKTFYSPGALEAIDEHAGSVLRALEGVAAAARAAQTALHFQPIEGFSDVEAVVAVAGAMESSPGAPVSVLLSDDWNAPSPVATDIVQRARLLQQLRGDLTSRLAGAAFERDHASDIQYVERKSRGIVGVLAALDGKYRAIRRRWKTYRIQAQKGSLKDQIGDLRVVDHYRAEREILEGFATTAKELFGGLWRGEGSNVAALEAYVAWVVSFRAVCVKYRLTARTIEIASTAKPDVATARSLQSQSATATKMLTDLHTAVGWPEAYLRASPFAAIAERLGQLRERLLEGPRWAAFQETLQAVSKGLARDLLPFVFSGQVSCRDLPRGFQRAFLMKWLSQVVEERPPLAKFHSLTHEERVAEFRDLDRRVLRENRATLVGQLRERVQHNLQRPDAAAALPSLQREMAKQRNLSPLRKTLRESEPAIRAIKPCFLMSPLTVAQYIRGGEPAFDLVIFDEASQLPPEDAVGAVVRGKQLAVVGDPKQLPPTSFFNASLEHEELYTPDGTPIYQDSESVLEEFMGAGLPMSQLKWHYRSAHESLITFSNITFYDAGLRTFPSVETKVGREGLSFEYVNGGHYEGKGLNAVEARRVADEVVRFAREQLRHREMGGNAASLGVGTFNLRQQVAIQDELEVRRRANPEIEPFFDRAVDEPFFVKNLENIQGDERDVIFISVTYGRALDGQLRYQFGPLNSQNGWRRLNVLTTRARRQMRVFSSMRGDEISPAAVASDGPRLLREFLTYAEHGRLDSKLVSDLAETESTFEREVMGELVRLGINVVPQVGAAGYRIDLGVLSNDVPGRFVCGIECDGVAYHSSESARDRDRLRQQVLEARGWILIRVWSTDWFKDRAGQVARLVKAIEVAGTKAKNEVIAAREADGRALESAQAESAIPGVAQPGSDFKMSGVPATGSVQRPQTLPYQMAPGEDRFAGNDILEAEGAVLLAAVQNVIDIEAPIHISELMTRVAAMWGTKAGSRIQNRILGAASSLVGRGTIRRMGDFFWTAKNSCPVRSRANTRIPADRIAPEEFEQAILAVLDGGRNLPRPLLTAEVRSALGYSKTGAIIEEAVSEAISRLLASGRIGDGSAGLRMRSPK